MKKWAYKNPLISSLILNILYLYIARGMILANSFNILNNGVIVMIAILYVLLGMVIKEISTKAEGISKVKKQIIWGSFALVVIYTLFFSKLFGLLK